MVSQQVDDRSPERRALDEQIAAEPHLPSLKASPDALRTTLEAYLKARRMRRVINARPGHTQLIGGTDCVLATNDEASAFDIGARVIQRYWPKAKFRDAATGDEYQGYSEIPLGYVNQLLIYRSPDVEQDWVDGDLDVPPNTMLYLVRASKRITIAVDDAGADEMALILSSLRSSLAMDILNHYAEAA